MYAFHCPECGAGTLQTVEYGRHRKYGYWRRRRCAHCLNRYSTIETNVENVAEINHVARGRRRFKIASLTVPAISTEPVPSGN